MANEKILVVDDDTNICELLRLYLTKEGYQVTTANDGEEGLEKFNQLKPDMVLLDVMMPRMDGLEVCRRIRKLGNTPVMMLTAKGETFDKVLGLELGADDYMVKPFDTKEVVARIKGRKTPEGDRRAAVLRADIDALPIREQSGAAWSSENDGVMHACGHDIHAAVLYGTLLRLSAERNFEGTLFGIFQPGEESNPGGASKVLAENPFEGYTVLAVVGEHVEPALDAGTLGFRAGKYMASNDELRLTLEGAGGHAAMRAEHRDTVSAAAQLILHLTALNTPERVVSIGKVEAAGATNVIPDRVYMEGTMRTFDERERAEVKRRIEELAAANDASYGIRTRVHFTPGYPCVVNDPELIRQAVALAETEGIPFQMLPLRMTSEDFGFYGTRYPAIFYRLGVGPGAGKLHTSTFNPDEAAIPTGIRFMELLARNYFNR